MKLDITRLDGTSVEIHDGAMRLIAQIDVNGTAKVIDAKTGTTFLVERLSDGSLAEVTLQSPKISPLSYGKRQ